MTVFVGADDVAELIGMDSGAAFLRARARLEEDASFPTPMPTCLRPLKWRRAAIEAWLDTQGQRAPINQAQAAAAGPNVVLMQMAGQR